MHFLKLKIFEVIRMRSSPNLKQQLKENMSFTIILFHEIMPDRVSFYVLYQFYNRKGIHSALGNRTPGEMGKFKLVAQRPA